jgi:site-specific DNA-methyltransferase (adenine-specific)
LSRRAPFFWIGPMAEVCQIGPVTIYHDDALTVLPTLQGVADLCVTDMPYRLTSGGRGTSGDGSMSGIFDAEDYDNSGDLVAMAEWHQMVPPVYRALKANADAYLMTNDKNIFLAGGAATGAGFKFHNMLTWDKGAPTPNRWYMKHIEFTLYLWKGKGRAIANAGSKQMFVTPRPKDRVHPTQKPVALMDHYIRNSSKEGDLVIDPFCGAGSTLIAAALAGRRAIGIEIDRTHFDAACSRLETAIGAIQ